MLNLLGYLVFILEIVFMVQKMSKCEQRVPNCYYHNIVHVTIVKGGLPNNHALWKHGAL